MNYGRDGNDSMRKNQDGDMIWTHHELFSSHPVPNEHSMERHPKVHPHDILDNLYHASMHRPNRTPTQHGVLRGRVRRNDSAKFPKVYANISTCHGGAPRDGTMLKHHNKVLRRIKRKVLNPHSQIIHDESPLPTTVAR